MVYECEACSVTLPPGATACPKCSERFDEPVPADAEIQRGFTAASAALHPSRAVPLYEGTDPGWLTAPVVLTQRREKRPIKLQIAGGIFILSGLVLALFTGRQNGLLIGVGGVILGAALLYLGRRR